MAASTATLSWNETKGDDDMIDAALPGGLGDTRDILSQSERIKRFGIDCLGPAGDGILFKAGTWKPGGEYVQKLIIRNVSTHVQKLKYKLPSTRFFSLAYPEIMVLSPGMSAELDVIFRPIENDPYADTIFIRVLGGSGGFHVSVKATIDKLIVTAPYGLDLGFCPTHQTTTKAFQLNNQGEIDAPFRWEQPKGFKLEPASGIIAAGTTLDIFVSVVPTDASVVVAQAVCSIGGPGVHALIDEPIVTTRLSAIGKYAFISLSETALDFGEVLTGTRPESIKKEMILKNTSVVPAEFSMVRHEADQDPAFELFPSSGVIPPQSDVTITVKYHALGAGCYNLDRFTFLTPGDCRTSVTLSGTAMAPKVTLAKEPAITQSAAGPDGSIAFSEAAPGNSLNFRDVEVGKGETRILQLKNTSQKDVHFSILTGADGMFRCSPMRGVIKAEGPPFSVVVSFHPPGPMNYYKRVWVLLSDALPLFYDCLGSGYIRAKGDIKEQRPAPIRHAHVQAYRNRAVHGMGGLSPDELDAAYTSGNADPSFFGQIGTTGTRAMSLTTLANPLTRSGETSRVDIAVAHEFFIEDTDLTCREISSSQKDFDFGFIPQNSTSESKSVSVANNTNGKVTLVWQIPRTVNDAGDFEIPAFEVTPNTVDISPGQSASFKIIFRPFQTDRNFVSELEAFVFFKNQRTFRLVNDTTLTPPWCLTFNASGHTFSSGQLLATARILGGNVRGGKLIFPGCFEGETLYQSITLHNTSNLPSTFRFETGFGDGDVAPGGAAIDTDAFHVRPSRGEVAAESFAVIYVRFTPSKSRKYVQLLRCFVNGDPSTKLLLEGTSSVPFVCCPDVKSDDRTRREPPAHVYGADNSERVRPYLNIPGITAAPHLIPHGPLGSFYMKPTCVGLSTSRKFTLKNQSRLPLRYRITLPPEAEGIISVTPSKGLLRGNQVTTLTIAFAPQASTKYMLKVKIATFPIGGRAQRVIDSRQPMGTAPPEVLQNLSFLIVAPGEIGAVQFNPRRLSMDVRLVNTSERQDMYLENVSDSDISYKLMYREEYLRDTGSTPSASAARENLEISALRPLKMMNAESDESLMCDAPTGILQARSRKRCPLAFQPTKAGQFDFIIFCQIQVLVEGSSAMVPNEEIALLRVSQKDRESNAEGVGASSLAGLPLTTHVSTRATFPKISIADVRVEHVGLVSSVDNLWRNFSLRALNTELSKPLTDKECNLNASSSPDLSKLRRYRLEFTPDLVGSPQQKVTFLFKNNGHLTTNFHLHLPNEKELELEQWCDEDEPSEELNKIICMIEELKLFTIEPAHGILEPGQSINISITYSHAHLKFGGVHNLPVHVKLDKGKQFFLDLIGRTLPIPKDSLRVPPTGSRLLAASARGEKKPLPLTHINALPPTDIMLTACTGQDGRYELEPVPIGLDPSEAPLQRMQLINVSGAKAIYDIDMASIDHLIDHNFGQPILRTANRSGIIEPRSSVYIEWYFYPLEAKAYEIPITIMYDKVSEAGDPMDTLANPSIISGDSQVSGAGLEQGSMTQSLTLSPPPRGSKPASGRGKKETSSVSPEVKFVLIGTGYDPRQKVLVDNRILDRPRPDKKPGYTIFGEKPPTEQLITFPRQLASISSDTLDLQFVPQGSKCSRLIVIRNLSITSVEFNINVDSCRLFQEGILNMYPLSGVLEPEEFVLIDFNFSLDTRSMVLMDDVTITVSEIISKGGSQRRGGIPSKLLDRVLKKSAKLDHESVVKRITYARNMQLEMNLGNIPENRTASMPSTVAANGVVQSGVAHSLNPELNNQGATTKSKGIGFENSFAAGSMTGESLNGGNSGVGTKTGRSETGQSGSSKIGGSGMMSRNRKKTDDNRVLLGVSNPFIIRIRGFVMTFETTYKLFHQMGGTGVVRGLSMRDAAAPVLDESGEAELPKSGCMIDFFVPPKAPFIPTISAATFFGAVEPPVKSKLANALSKLNEQKEFEVRDVAQSVMHELFRTLLGAASISEYTEEVVSDTVARCVTLDNINGASVVCTATLKVNGPITKKTQLDGGALVGVYFDELRQQIGLQHNEAVEEVSVPVEELERTGGLNMELVDIDEAVTGPLEDGVLAEGDFTSNPNPNHHHHHHHGHHHHHHGHHAESAAALNTSQPLSPAAKARKVEEHAQLRLAMQQQGFPDIAAEILRNTFYNLMQEAAFSEFAITAEPLQFAIKEKEKKDRF